MKTSRFSNSQDTGMHLEKVDTNGSTCDTFRCRIYGKLIFVKKLKSQYASDIRYREAMQKEFETGFRLEHPNLARHLSYNGEEMHIEYIDGVTLTGKLANDPDYFKKRENSDKFITQLLSAVQYLHENQVLHLDIKPDNIMLTRINNDVKLIDLGFCHTDCYTDTDGHTKLYCSPEQIDGNSTDERSDIYTIGCIIDMLPNRHIYRKIIARCTKEKKEHRYRKIEHIILPRPISKTITAIIATAIPLLAFIAFYTSGANADEQAVLALTAKNENSSDNFGNMPSETKNISKETAVNNLNKTAKKEENYKKRHDANERTAQVQMQMQMQAIEYESGTGSFGKTALSKSPKENSDTAADGCLAAVPQLQRSDSMNSITDAAANEINRIIEEGKELKKRTAEEFDIFKVKINGYLEKVITFVNDSSNLVRYPSYYGYDAKYKENWRECLKEIREDTWTYSRYKSINNPYGTYVKALRDSIESKFYKNCSILP